MRTRNFAAAASAALIFAGGFGAANGFGDRAPAAPGGFDDLGTPELTVASTGEARASGKKNKRKSKRQTVTNLVTTRAIPVDPGASVFIKLKCKVKEGKKTVSKGEPVSGGAILPAEPGLELTANSHFNPNDLSTDRRSHFVAVRNTGAEAATFLASVSCLDGVKEE